MFLDLSESELVFIDHSGVFGFLHDYIGDGLALVANVDTILVKGSIGAIDNWKDQALTSEIIHVGLDLVRDDEGRFYLKHLLDLADFVPVEPTVQGNIFEIHCSQNLARRFVP